MEKEKVCVSQNYFPVVVGQEYVVLHRGYDYVTVRCKGKPVHIPIKMLGKLEQKGEYREYLPTYDEIIEAERQELNI